eukprot:SAG31_NODE_27829_length_419_cov_1.131250_2_plen_22_part_01
MPCPSALAGFNFYDMAVSHVYM